MASLSSGLVGFIIGAGATTDFGSGLGVSAFCAGSSFCDLGAATVGVGAGVVTAMAAAGFSVPATGATGFGVSVVRKIEITSLHRFAVQVVS